MPLKIEPMREEDYLQMGKEVKEGFDDGNVFMPASLNSPSIFGSVEYAPGEDRPVGIDHTGPNTWCRRHVDSRCTCTQ